MKKQKKNPSLSEHLSQYQKSTYLQRLQWLEKANQMVRKLKKKKK